MSGYLGTMTATGPGFSFQVFGSKGWVRLEGMTHVAGASSEERRTRLFGTCKFQPVKGDGGGLGGGERSTSRARASRRSRPRRPAGRAVPDPARGDGPRRGGHRGGGPLGRLGQSRKSRVTRGQTHEPRQRSRPPDLLDARASRRQLGRDVDEPHDVSAAGEGARGAERAVRRLPAAGGTVGDDPRRRARRERDRAEALLRRQRHVPLHGRTRSPTGVQEPGRQGAGLRARLALPRSARSTR